MTLASVVDSLNVLLPPIIVGVIILGNYKKSAMVDPMLRRLFFVMTGCFLVSFALQIVYNELNGAGMPAAMYWLKFTLLFFEHVAYFMTYVFVEYLANRTMRLTIHALTAVALFMLLQVVLLIANLSSGFYYSVTPAGEVVEEPFYLIRYIYTSLPVLMVLNDIFIYRRRAMRDMWGMVLLFLVPISLTNMVDDLLGSKLRWSISIICILYAYLFIIRNDMYTDVLTRIRNRLGLSAYAADIERAARGRPMAFIMMDIDDFKSINDRLGHIQGDRALVDVAAILRSSIHYTDIVARVGGDEFAIITRNERVEGVIERINGALADFNARGIRPYTLSLSIGSYVYDPKAGASFGYALDQADKMMYEKKKQTKERQRLNRN